MESSYSTNLPVDTAAGLIEFTRDFAAVDAHLHGRVYRFVNTHLEVRGGGDLVLASVRFAQATELVEILDADKVTLIVVGDYNSSEVDRPLVTCEVPAGPELVCPTPYEVMIDGGYIDVWERRHAASRSTSDTCCQDKDLLNAESLLDRRIDLIWVRAAKAHRWGPVVLGVQTKSAGDEQADRTPSELWYSDHAGVNTRMVLRAPYEGRSPRQW